MFEIPRQVVKTICAKVMDSISNGFSKYIDDLWNLYETDGWFLTSMSLDDAYSKLEHDLPPFVMKVSEDHRPFYLIGSINTLRAFTAIERTIEILKRTDKEWAEDIVSMVLHRQMVQFDFASLDNEATVPSTGGERYTRCVVETGSQCIAAYYRDEVTKARNIKVTEPSRVDADSEVREHKIMLKLFTVYTAWKTPGSPLEKNDLEEYLNKRSQYDIWIREPRAEICYRGAKFDSRRKFPDPRLIRVLKAILMRAHEECIPLIDLFKSLRPYETRVSETLVRSNKKQIANALSDCRSYFPNCLECTWNYDDPFSRMFLKKNSFTYCFIEPLTSPLSYETF